MSEFWKRKMRTYLALFDFDNDGVISKEDWDKMPVLFASFKEADQQKADHLKTQFHNLWAQFLKEADAADVEKNVLTGEVLAVSVWKQRYGRELKKCLWGIIHGFYDLMDFNSDGYLDDSEYLRHFHQLGVPDTSYAKETFNAMDVNHDGKLSFQEFIEACYDFFFSEDEKSPFTLFFGPLVD